MIKCFIVVPDGHKGVFETTDVVVVSRQSSLLSTNDCELGEYFF